jgi:hypothetical protein
MLAILALCSSAFSASDYQRRNRIYPLAFKMLIKIAGQVKVIYGSIDISTIGQCLHYNFPSAASLSVKRKNSFRNAILKRIPSLTNPFHHPVC